MSNTTPTPSTPKAPKPKQPADTAGQTTVIPTATAAPAAQPAPTPAPKAKHKLPRWIWSAVASVVGFFLGLALPQFMIAAICAITLWRLAPAIVSWIHIQNEKRQQKAEEEERAAIAAATAAGQPITPTAKAPRGPSWQAMLGSFIGMIVGIVVTVVLNWAIVMFSPGVAGQAYILPIANIVLVAMATWIGYAIGVGTGRK